MVNLFAPPFVVRKAIATDASSLQLLEQESREEVQQFRGHQALLGESPNDSDGWLQIVASIEHSVLVAEVAQQVVAYICAEFNRASLVCSVTQIFVDPQARQLGIGARLVGETATIARDYGCIRLDAYALPGDRKMKNLFERVGMPARLIVASRTL
ncbi:MAG: GNAT family N-acetyltransferase [Actinobacteria bacterium]|nr:MAG: GNAT family N-acetyltransferase [Actinomycetota bacterium]